MQSSPCGKYVLTGAYNSQFHLMDTEGTVNMTMTANFDANKRAKVCSTDRAYNGIKLPPMPNAGTPDLTKKILLASFHPLRNTFAVANHNCIFLFNQEKEKRKKK